MGLATLLCISALFFVISNVDPYQGTNLTFAFFYSTVFFSVLGISSVLLFFAHKFFSKQAMPLFKYVSLSFRDSVFVSIFFTIVLYLQIKDWLSIWNFGLLFFIFILVISFKATLKNKQDSFVLSDND